MISNFIIIKYNSLSIISMMFLPKINKISMILLTNKTRDYNQQLKNLPQISSPNLTFLKTHFKTNKEINKPN